MSDSITYSRKGSKVTLCLNRPEIHNRLSEKELLLMSSLLAKAESEKGVRVIILTAAEGPVFCSGFAIDMLQQTNWENNQFWKTVSQIENLRLPVICQISGAIYGGACELAMVCDLRIGSDEVVIQTPPARLGLIYPPEGLKRFISRLGPGPTKRLFLTAQKITSEDLFRIGFLDYIVPKKLLADTTAEISSLISELSPKAVQEMKHTINSIISNRIDMDISSKKAIKSFNSYEAREGISAFLEKRTPKFDDL